MTEIYMATNHIMLVSGYGNPEVHSHGSAHILISLNEAFTCTVKDVSCRCRGIMVPGYLPHTVDSGNRPILVFLLEQSQSVGSRITSTVPIPEEIVDEIRKDYVSLTQAADRAKAYPEFYRSTMGRLGFENLAEVLLDERISRALELIEERIGQELTAAETAEQVYLSESWFSHLFREQMGIAFSSYVVMRKIYHTYMGLVAGKTITEAALDAGFSSPSHFAAANKRMFGITASDLAGDYRLYRTTDI